MAKSDHEDDERSSNSDDESAGDDGEDVQVESLIAGREKRSTAGNRLATLLGKEAADDELELLFAEDEDDVEFDEGGDGYNKSDDQLSSDEDEDQGPTAAGDDEFSGEKELQRAARATRLGQKRKANANFFKVPVGGPAKRVKINANAAIDRQETPGTTPTPAGKSKKKKLERVSWMPAIEAEPTRASSRRATMKNRETTVATMKEREERRVQQVAAMEAAAAKRELVKPKTLSQADRLAEAARTEKANSKSLSRWEEAEEKRAGEQQARLDALQNRKIDGPVVSFWSGVTEWLNGRVRHVGKRPKEVVDGDADISGPRRKGGKQGKSMGPPPLQSIEADKTALTPADTTTVAAAAAATPDSATPELAASAPAPTELLLPPQIAPTVQDEPAASLPESEQAKDVASSTTPTETAAVVEQNAGMTPAPSSTSGDSKTPAVPSPSPASAPPPPPQALEHSTLPSPPKVASPPKPSAQIEYSNRNLVTFTNFPPALEKAHPLIFKKPGPKAHLRPQLCAITSRPARYRDPTTGVGYYDAATFRELRRLRAGAFRWSALLQCYTGARGAAAKGVPPRFLTPEVRRDEAGVPGTPRGSASAVVSASTTTTPAAAYTPTPAPLPPRRESARRKLAGL